MEDGARLRPLARPSAPRALHLSIFQKIAKFYNKWTESPGGRQCGRGGGGVTL